MSARGKPSVPSALPALAGAAAATVYGILFLNAESERAVAALLVLAVVAIAVAGRAGILSAIGSSIAAREGVFDRAAIVGVLVAALWLHQEHFALLLMTTAALLMLASLGLTVQFAYAGVVNFAGAAFLAVGCYTAAVLTHDTDLPTILTLPLGGAMAALVGSVLILPVLRTRGHYAALVTIAFGILFKTFLEVNDTLGGPQGMQVRPIVLLGRNLNSPIRIGDFAASFYLNYFLLAFVLVIAGFALVRRLERSWVGLCLDAVRLDEIASACYGLDVGRWKILAFTCGNFLIGIAGALYAHVLGFIAPNNFTFGDSLVLVSIVLLGGIGNPWGVAVASAFVVLVPEKFQVIQEYRFLLYAALVILILLFRPQGLLPRGRRIYPPGGVPAGAP